MASYMQTILKLYTPEEKSQKILKPVMIHTNTHYTHTHSTMFFLLSIIFDICELVVLTLFASQFTETIPLKIFLAYCFVETLIFLIWEIIASFYPEPDFLFWNLVRQYVDTNCG